MAPTLPASILSNGVSFSQLSSYGVIVLFAFFIVVPTIRTLVSPLRKVPGPFLARFTRLWEATLIQKNDYALNNIALHEKYGMLSREIDSC